MRERRTPNLTRRSYIPLKVDYSDLYDIMTFVRAAPGQDADGGSLWGDRTMEGVRTMRWGIRSRLRGKSGLGTMCVNAKSAGSLTRQWRQEDMVRPVVGSRC